MRDAGLATVGMIAIDGTKIAANASRDRTVDYEQLARAIVDEAIATTPPRPRRYGEARGDELPAIVASRQGREGWLRAARQRPDQQRAQQAPADSTLAATAATSTPTLPPKRLRAGLRAVRLSRPYRLRTMGLSGFSGGARCPVWVPTFSEVLTRIQ